MDKNEKEERLVKKAIKGDVDAYGKLIECYQEYLYKTAWLYVRDEDFALDVVQESILKGFGQIKTLKKPEYFKTWMTRILINSARDIYRNNRKLLFFGEPEQQVHIGKNAEKTETEIEERMDLYDAIERLSECYRSVVILKYFSDMKLAEISEVLQIPEGSVSAYLTRAKQELKKYLREGYQYV